SRKSRTRLRSAPPRLICPKVCGGGSRGFSNMSPSCHGTWQSLGLLRAVPSDDRRGAMKTRDLAHEMREAFAAMEPRDVQQLVELGVPEIFIEHFQMVGLARVREDRSRSLYFPEPRGRLAFVTPVCVQYDDTPESTCPEAFPLIGNLIDLVAWDERAPDVWRLRTGAASWLGAISPQYVNPEPAPIQPSPLSWLQHRC